MRRTDAKLRASEIRLAQAQKLARLGSWSFNPASGRARWSTETYRIYGIDPDTPPLTGAAFLERLHPEDRERYRAHLAAALRDGCGFEVEYRIVNATGETRWVHSIGAAIIGEKGEVREIHGTIIDLTERKLREAALKSSEERLSLALAGSDLALFDWNIRDHRIYLSEQWATLLQASPGETVMTPEAFIALVHPDERESVREAWFQVLQAGTLAYDIEHRVLTGNGVWIWIRSRGKVVERNPAGEALRFAGTHADITDRKAIEQAKQEFVATVSHELRTPLTAMIASLGVVRDELPADFPAPLRHFLDMAQQNGARLTALVDDILDVEKLDAGQMEFRFAPVELCAFLAQAVELNRPCGDANDVRFEIEPPLPSERVAADPDRLMQVMTNLLSNAAKFSPPGERVTVRAALQDRMVRVSVTDRGPGVPEDFRSRIFQRFSRADGSDTRTKRGTGLGLSLSREMLEKMGGRIGFESIPGSGATFYFDVRPWAGAVPRPTPE